MIVEGASMSGHDRNLGPRGEHEWGLDQVAVA